MVGEAKKTEFVGVDEAITTGAKLGDGIGVVRTVAATLDVV